MQTSSFATRHATLIGAFAPIGWSFMPIGALWANVFPPLLLTAIVFLCTCSIGLSLWIARRNPLRELTNIPLRFFIPVTLSLFTAQFGFIYTMRIAPPAEVILLFNTWPFMLLMSSTFLKEHILPRHIIGCLLGFSGVIFIAFYEGFERLNAEHILGYLLALGTAVCWTIYSIFSHKYSHIDSGKMTTIFGLMGMAALLLHFFIEPVESYSSSAWIAALFFGIVAIGVSFFCWDFGMKHGNLQLLSIMGYLEPIGGILLVISFGFALFKWQIAVAGTLIIGGILIATWQSQRG